MRELFERIGIEYKEDNEYKLTQLQLKQDELTDALERVEDDERRLELQNQYDEIEKAILDIYSTKSKETTGLYKEVEDYSELKNGENGAIFKGMSEKEQFEAAAALLTNKDSSLAIDELTRLANKGNVYAQTKLGEIYFQGKYTVKNVTEGLKWYDMASRQGDGTSSNRLGNYYYSNKAFSNAVSMYQRAQEQNNAYGYYNIGKMYSNGQYFPKNPVNAFEMYKKSAELGAVEGMVQTGMCYAKGIGTLKDDGEAKKYFEEAAAKKNAVAHNWLGYLYEEGRFGEKDINRALDWYEKGAACGGENCAYAAARIYFEKGEYQKAWDYALDARRKNVKEADGIINKIEETGYILSSHRSLAESGHTDQQVRLARAYEKGGLGVEKDEKLATYWYERAALANNQEALAATANRYKKGLGVEKDIEKAKKYKAMITVSSPTKAQHSAISTFLLNIFRFLTPLTVIPIRAYCWYGISPQWGAIQELLMEMVVFTGIHCALQLIVSNHRLPKSINYLLFFIGLGLFMAIYDALWGQMELGVHIVPMAIIGTYIIRKIKE
jgi:TPR repeat protein